MADEISSSSSSANLSIVQTFRSELRSGFDREDLNENSSFISYLKFALDSILKQEPLQSALKIIEEELTGHVDRKATAIYGEKLPRTKGNAETEAKKEKRAKFVKDYTARRADGVFNMGNRVLEFLRDYQQGKLDKNVDYQMFSNSSGQSIDPNTSSPLDLVNSLPQLDTTMLANEQLRLSLNHPRKGLKSKAAELYDIVTRNDDVVIDLTTNEDIGKLSLSVPAKESFRHVLRDYNKARGNVDEEEQENEEVQGASTKRTRKQTERFSTTISISKQNTRNKKRPIIEAEPLPIAETEATPRNKKRSIIEAEPLPIALLVETEPNPNKNKRTRRETGSATEADLSDKAATSANAVADEATDEATDEAVVTPVAVVTVAATTDADLSEVVASSATAVANAAVVTTAAVVTVAATTDADLSEVVANSATAVANAAVVTTAAVVTVAATTDADLSEVVANSANAVADPAVVTTGSEVDSGATAAALITPVALETVATPVALETVAATDEATEEDLSLVAAMSAKAVADAGATPVALETVAATDEETEEDLSLVAAMSAKAVADAGATPVALETVAATDEETEADLSSVAAMSANDPSVEAVVSANALSASEVTDTTAGTSELVIKFISDYNPPLDELIRFSTAVVNQLQEKFNNVENGKSLWTKLQNFNTSQEVVLLSTESEVNAPNISHSHLGSGTTSTPPVVAVSLVDILEENDIHIRESILPPAKELFKLSIWIPKGMDDLSNRDNFMAICFSQAFILYSWPRQQKLQQFDRMKEIVRKLIAADFSVAVAGAEPTAEATVASTNEELLLSIKEFVLDLGSIEITPQLPESRRSSTSSQSAPIQMDCIQEAIAKTVQTIPAEHFSEHILFSVQVQLKTNELSTRRIPLSFPVKIGSERVIFQLLAATFEKVKKKVTTTLIRFINRYGAHDCGRYMMLNTDGKVKTNLDKKGDGGLPFVENEFSVRNLVFVKGNSFTQDEFNVAYKLKGEVLFTSHSVSVSGDNLYKFIQESGLVEDDIIQSYCSRVYADFQKIEAISSQNQHERSSIVFPVQFTNNIEEFLSRTISESEKKHIVGEYMNSLIGDRSLNESTILHVVMNLDNWHWNYLTVVFSTRTICVWDSLLEVGSFEDSKETKLQNLFTVFTWEYERRNKKKLSGEWQRKDLMVPQQEAKENPKVSCGVYCMVFLMRGFLEGLFSVAPFESHVDLSGDGVNTFNKQLLRNLRASIADVIMGSSTVLSIMSFFLPEYMYKSVHKNLMHTCHFPCKKKMAARTSRPIV